MSKKAELIVAGRTLAVSNLDKVLYPKDGFTKGELINYYIQIAPILLPHLKDRPLTMKRYPDGVEGEFFYEKNCPSHRPKWVQTAKVWSESNQRTVQYCLAQDLPTLVWAANLADIELHTSLSRKGDVARPTMMVFDLDPGAPADIVQCCQVGLWLREILSGMKLKSWAKTSGSKGLQVYVPLNTAVTYEQTKELSHAHCGTSRARASGPGRFQNGESAAPKEKSWSIGARTTTQDHHLCLFVAGERKADRFDAGDLGRSRGDGEKEERQEVGLSLRSNARASRETGRPLRAGRDTQTKAAQRSGSSEVAPDIVIPIRRNAGGTSQQESVHPLAEKALIAIVRSFAVCAAQDDGFAANIAVETPTGLGRVPLCVTIAHDR